MSKDIGGELHAPRFIVMHYTAGGSGVASRDYMLKSPTQKQRLTGAAGKVYGSAHIVIDRDGSVWQIVPFNRKARHAGRSSWRGLESLNRYAIGIEIANYGWLNQQGDGSYKRSDTPRFDAGQVTVAPMPSGSAVMGWENYPTAQLEAIERVSRGLLAAYPSIGEILGHQEIAPGRKSNHDRMATSLSPSLLSKGWTVGVPAICARCAGPQSLAITILASRQIRARSSIGALATTSIWTGASRNASPQPCSTSRGPRTAYHARSGCDSASLPATST